MAAKEAATGVNLDRGFASPVRESSLATVAGVAALVTVVGFVIGIALMVSSGVQTLIPETGRAGLEWIADVQGSGGPFFAGAWLVVFAGLVGLVALVCFYDTLRKAGPHMIIAPLAGAVGMTLVTISHTIPIAMASQIAPAYSETSGPTQVTLAVVTDTLASVSLLTNYVGNALGWGVTVPLYAIAILTTAILPRWIGWLGLVVAVFGGWLGLLSPVSDAVEAVTTIGFLGFFVFMASMGITLLRSRKRPTTPPAGTDA